MTGRWLKGRVPSVDANLACAGAQTFSCPGRKPGVYLEGAPQSRGLSSLALLKDDCFSSALPGTENCLRQRRLSELVVFEWRIACLRLPCGRCGCRRSRASEFCRSVWSITSRPWRRAWAWLTILHCANCPGCGWERTNRLPWKLPTGLPRNSAVSLVPRSRADLCSRFLERDYGIQLAYADEEADDDAAEATTANLLQVPRGHPLLRIRQVIYSTQGKTTLYVLGLYRSDRYNLLVRRFR